MDIIPVFRIDLAESWVSAEPMVQNKSAEPGSPYEILHIHGIWGDKAPQLLQGVGQIAMKMWQEIKTVRMHSASLPQLDQFICSYGKDQVSIFPQYNSLSFGYGCASKLEDYTPYHSHEPIKDDEDPIALFEIQAHVTPERAEQWDWVFGTTQYK
jgi:hypothetical protein